MPEPVYTIRCFLPEEVAAYKVMRLEALQTEPGMFGSNYAREAGFTDAQWLDRIINPKVACMGLYCDGELIGITGIITDTEQPELGHLVQSYIRKAYRGKGLTNILYKARIDWAQEHGIKRIEVGHRANNAPSIAATLKAGFKYKNSVSNTWPDGSTEDIVYYELAL